MYRASKGQRGKCCESTLVLTLVNKKHWCLPAAISKGTAYTFPPSTLDSNKTHLEVQMCTFVIKDVCHHLRHSSLGLESGEINFVMDQAQ